MIVDAASGWDDKARKDPSFLTGHGLVPVRIEEIIKTPNNEIKFVVGGVSEKYDTYNYRLPVPYHDDKYPFVAKATLCYFPKCSINQGVDYTNTEMDIYLGRVKNNKKTNNPVIKSINKNTQSIIGGPGTHEREARGDYRKWDNTKHICEFIPGKKIRPRMAYQDGNKMWGISLKTKERLISRDGAGVKFGLVVTLREINGVNRFEDFIRRCLFRGWLVNRIDIETHVEIYNQAKKRIDFDNPTS